MRLSPTVRTEDGEDNADRAGVRGQPRADASMLSHGLKSGHMRGSLE